MFAQLSATALNHLLAQNAWAYPRLARFAGKTARFDIAPFSFACTILPDGALAGADKSVSADATCTIPPSLLPRLALRDEQAHAEVQTSGDTALLSEIFYLSRNLVWDAAEDLSHVTGDIAAERIVQAVQTRQAGAAAASLAHSAAEYLTEENPLLAKPEQIDSFMSQVDTLRDDISRLDMRIRRLFAASERKP